MPASQIACSRNFTNRPESFVKCGYCSSRSANDGLFQLAKHELSGVRNFEADIAFGTLIAWPLRRIELQPVSALRYAPRGIV
jgi:hypothetical protein